MHWKDALGAEGDGAGRHLKELSPTSYTFKWEMKGPQGWTTVLEGKEDKAK